ncbi:MAG: hypothetical protein JSR77_08395 [Planctomycetes bacterium]|nr:hypothetical protein [Planctomycetota bacterium]
MSRDTKVQAGALAALLVCFISSIGLATGLTALAGREKLAATDQATEGQSKEVAVGIAMGAFRGIFVNFLWMRANAMKEDGKFFDAIELASAITKLQPRFPRVWVFHAWNMAYNISVMTQTSEERWNWVNAGIHLLRDQGIPANPNDMLLHKELGWIFLHKIGGFTDDANAYYKRRLAMEWTIVLGPPPARTPEDRDRDHRIKVMTDWLSVVANAPDSLEELFAANPDAKALADKVIALGFKLDEGVLGRYEMHKASASSVYRADYQAALKSKRKVDTQPTPMEELTAMIDDPAMQKSWDALLPTMRKRVLIDNYHMEPDRMIRYTQKYGPMDWRHHGSHAVYWSARGVELGLSRLTHDNRRDFDTLNTDRITVQGIQELFRTGDVYFDFFASMLNQYTVWIGAPDPHFVLAYGDIIEDARSRSWADQLDNRGFSPLTAGYENFLKDTICFFYRRNDLKGAEYWYSRLRTYKGLNQNYANRAAEMSVPLREFVDNELNDRFTSPNVAVAQVVGALTGAYTSGLLSGDTDLFSSQFEYAKRGHRYFMEQQRKAVVVNRDYVRMDQMEPDFRVEAGVVLVNVLASLSLDDAEKLYGRAPADLKKFAYDPLAARYRESVDERAKRFGSKKFDEIFPEPPDMPQFRAAFKKYADERVQGKPDTELK